MRTLTLTHRMNFPANQVWPFLADYANIHRVHPAIKASYLNADSPDNGLGAERTCEMHGGMSLVEKVIDWQEGQSYTVSITRTNMPLDYAQAKLGVRALGTSHSEAVFKMTYHVKFGVLGEIMDFLFMRFMLRFMVSMLLKKLEQSVMGTATRMNRQHV